MKKETKEQIRIGHHNDPTFINQQVEHLGKQGYQESCSDPNWFAVSMEHYQAQYPDVQFVEHTGEYAIRQIAYLPRGKRTVLAMLKRELAQYEEQVAGTRVAIAKMEEGK